MASFLCSVAGVLFDCTIMKLAVLKTDVPWQIKTREELEIMQYANDIASAGHVKVSIPSGPVFSVL